MSTSTSHKGPGGRERDSGSGGGGDEGGGGGGDGDGGRLVKVGFGRTQVEAEMLQGFLAETGIPSVLKRTIGFDAPEFFASGPHDVFVSARDAKRAREVLAEMTIEEGGFEQRELEEERRLARGETGDVPPARLAFWLVAVALGGCLLAWLLYQAA